MFIDYNPLVYPLSPFTQPTEYPERSELYDRFTFITVNGICNNYIMGGKANPVSTFHMKAFWKGLVSFMLQFLNEGLRHL